MAILTAGLVPLWLNFGNEVVEIDFISQQIPFILETKRMLATGSPWWSWNTYSGDNFIGAYSFYTVTSPFVWLCCCFSARHILWGILLSLYLKTVCTSVFAYLYFRKMRLPDKLCMLGGLLYAFSSYYVANLFYFHFCEPLMLFPLLLIAIEKVLNNEQRCYFWLAMAAFGVAFINFYFSFGTLLLGLIYFIVRGCGDKKINVRILSRAIAAVAVGLMMASVILVPVVMHHIGTARGGVSFTQIALFGCDLSNIGGLAAQFLPMLRALTMPDASEGIEAFAVSNSLISSTECYLPVLGVFLAMVYMFKKRTWLTWTIVLLLVMYFTPLNGIFTLFTDSSYHRWLYGLSLLLILASLKVIAEDIEVDRRMYITYLTVCGTIVAVSLMLDSWYQRVHGGSMLDFNPVKIYEVGSWLINMAMLYLFVSSRFGRKNIVALVAVSAVMEMAAFSYFNFGHGAAPSNTNRCSRIFTLEHPLAEDNIVSDLRYRIDNESYFRNFGLMYNKPGIYGFNSSPNVKMNRIKLFMSGEVHSPSLTNEKSRETAAALFSVRDVYDYRDTLKVPYVSGLSLKSRCRDYDVYSFDHHIPMGFTYDSYITEDELLDYRAKNPGTDEILLMLDNLVIRAADIDRFGGVLAHGRIDGGVRLDSLAAERRRRVVKNFVGDTRGYRCQTDFDSRQAVFFSIVDDPGFTARIDGVASPIYEVNFGLSAVIVPAGKHSVEVSYFPSGMKAGAIISLLGLLILSGMFLWPYRRGAKGG